MKQLSNEIIQKINDINLAYITCNKSQPAFTGSKLTTETLEQGVKYIQSSQ